MLQIGVGTESETFLTTTLGVEFDQVAGDIFDMLLGAFLEPFPLAGAQGRKARRFAVVLRLVFRHLIERVDGHIDAAATIIEDLDHLLIAIPLRHAYQSTELSHAMIYMHHEVTDLKLLDLLQRECHLTTACLVALEIILMETVENLMIGENA